MRRYAKHESRGDWNWDIVDGLQPSNEILTAMATIETVKALDRVVSRLEVILSRLDSLGIDGIHEVIREARQQARLKRRKRLALKRPKRKLRAA